MEISKAILDKAVHAFLDRNGVAGVEESMRAALAAVAPLILEEAARIVARMAEDCLSPSGAYALRDAAASIRAHAGQSERGERLDPPGLISP